MTQKEYDTKSYEIRSFIADKFRDIQQYSAMLKNVEDEQKVVQNLLKIIDSIDEIKRGYSSLETLEATDESDSYLDDF